jgi:PBSX family phage terminase large subunit
MGKALNFGPRLASFAYRPPDEDRRLNILHGSVRSGKTWALHPKALYGCRYPVKGWRVFTGVTKATIFQNVLKDLFSIVGPRNYVYNHQSGYLKLCGSDWLVIGAKDEGSEKYVRGLTVGFAVCDEGTLMPEDFWNMLLTRMSPEGARLYATTNTDTPSHYIKAKVLDNEELRRAGLLWSMHCTMRDNPNLTPEFVSAQEKLFKGLFYQRLILGLWVMAGGSIYGDAWNEKSTFVDSDLPEGFYGPGAHHQRVISIDYGTSCPFVALDWRDDGQVSWCVDEWRWDPGPEADQRQKTDAQYADWLGEKLRGDRNPQFVVDPSAASMKLELSSRGYWVTDAENDVKMGINRTAICLSRGLIRFHRERCRQVIKDFEVYAWDPNAAKRGEEKPLHANSHSPDACRYYVATCVPQWRVLDPKYGEAEKQRVMA